MPFTLQQLSDLEDIKMLKHRYFRGIDTANWALLDGMFTADVHIEYVGGTYTVSLQGADNMLEFLKNSFHSQAVAMHHGHSPEIAFTGPDSAEGFWYLEDIFIKFNDQTHTYGTAIYRDRYIRENGQWMIASSVYDRVMEVIEPLHEGAQYTTHHLAMHGRRFEDCTDISHLITWEQLD